MKPFDFSTKKRLTLLIIAIVSSMGIYGLYLIKNSQQISLIYGVNHENTRCQINEYVVLANQFQLQIDYQKFGSIQLTGLRKNLDKFNYYIYKIEKKFTKDTVCQFSNVRYHVAHVNQKIAPYIPINADYVSYHPTQDKAVYCHYHETAKYKEPTQPRTACHFLAVENGLLVDYDISDLERRNLETYRQNTRIDSFNFTHSYVEKWQTKGQILFGILFLTEINQNSFGWGDYF